MPTHPPRTLPPPAHELRGATGGVCPLLGPVPFRHAIASRFLLGRGGSKQAGQGGHHLRDTAGGHHATGDAGSRQAFLAASGPSRLHLADPDEQGKTPDAWTTPCHWQYGEDFVLRYDVLRPFRWPPPPGAAAPQTSRPRTSHNERTRSSSTETSAASSRSRNSSTPRRCLPGSGMNTRGPRCTRRSLWAKSSPAVPGRRAASSTAWLSNARPPNHPPP